ncbi:hypothetical protein ACMUMQ_11955 [Marinomonas sp. 2405UD66-6]|uniref:hypothetical protein n=1 Tax=Marinomonas sp. 2405UD66-6 TaxID=3391834 RepID=UPI0039C8FB52
MNIDSPLTLVGIVTGAILTSLSAGWTFGYYSRSDRIETLETEVQSYRNAENLNMPATIRTLVNTNKSIEKNIAEVNAHYNWKAEEESLRSKISDLSAELENKTNLLNKEQKESSLLKISLNKAKRELELLSPINEEFWLGMGETKNFSGFDKTLGLSVISASSVIINFENRPKTLSIGDHVNFYTKGFDCKLILSNINTYNIRAFFNNVCTKTKDSVKN